MTQSFSITSEYKVNNPYPPLQSFNTSWEIDLKGAFVD